MFDVGFWELVLIFGLGLMILGPEKLPRVANQVGRWVGKARRTATELRRQLERELDFDDLAGSKHYSRPKPPPPPTPPAAPTVADHPPADDAEIEPQAAAESGPPSSTEAVEHGPQAESSEHASRPVSSSE